YSPRSSPLLSSSTHTATTENYTLSLHDALPIYPRNLPKELIAQDNTIAIRLTKDLFCKKLISKINSPLVSTSANVSGEPSPNSFAEISQKIKNEVDYIFPECETFVPKFTGSSIIKLSADGRVEVIRE